MNPLRNRAPEGLPDPILEIESEPPISINESQKDLGGVWGLECEHRRENKFIPQSHQKKAIQIYQKLINGQRGILLYHKFGSGKTCTSILVADYLLNVRANHLQHVWVLTPGNLRRNFHHEYCFVCGKYVANFKDDYTFISYNYSRLKADQLPSFNNSIIIIDEIHNLINTYLNAEQRIDSVAKTLITKLYNAKNIKIIALSGDPIYSRSIEAGVLFKLLKPSFDDILNIDELIKTPSEFKTQIQNLISYVPGKTEDFPQITETIVECQMSQFQMENFFPIEKSENKLRNFPFKTPLEDNRVYNSHIMTAKLYIRTRLASNFGYPTWAGLNIEWEKKDEDKKKTAGELKVEINEIEAELGDDFGKKEEEMIPDEGISISKSLYIVVAREGMKMTETSDNDSPEVKRLKKGDTFRPIGWWKRCSYTNGTVRCEVESDKVKGWITLPPAENRDAVILEAGKKKPDKLESKGGWVDTPDFKGQLEKYSRKFFAVLEKISTHFKGKHALYSFFKTRGGLYLMGTLFEMCGISYRWYTGDENDEQKTQILSEYNSPENKDGNQIKVLLFSSAGSEGISLTAVRHLHILETDLREGRARQVIGRTARYKSHAMLPEVDRKVQVWRYWSVTSFDEKEDQGIDRKLYNNAQLRYDALQQLLTFFEEASIEKTESAQDEKLDLEEVITSVSPEDENTLLTIKDKIRYALNRLLYWNYYLLNKKEYEKEKKNRIWKSTEEFRNSLIFNPKYIYTINKNNSISPLLEHTLHQEQQWDRISSLNCKTMTRNIAKRETEFLKELQNQKYDSELLQLFPLILNETKKINRFLNV